MTYQTPVSAGFLAKLDQYYKAIIAWVGAAVAVGTVLVTNLQATGADGSFSASDWIVIATAVFTAAGVQLKANAVTDKQKATLK